MRTIKVKQFIDSSIGGFNVRPHEPGVPFDFTDESRAIITFEPVDPAGIFVAETEIYHPNRPAYDVQVESLAIAGRGLAMTLFQNWNVSGQEKFQRLVAGDESAQDELLTPHPDDPWRFAITAGISTDILKDSESGKLDQQLRLGHRIHEENGVRLARFLSIDCGWHF
jgi:hypothetical protein